MNNPLFGGHSKYLTPLKEPLHSPVPSPSFIPKNSCVEPCRGPTYITTPIKPLLVKITSPFLTVFFVDILTVFLINSLQFYFTNTLQFNFPSTLASPSFEWYLLAGFGF